MIGIDNKSQYFSDKIKTEEEIIPLVRRFQDEKLTIGLCVGNFDLLHPGHMTHLQSAKDLCDILIAGITNDQFIDGKKGIGRPIYPEWLRRFSLSQLTSVDLIFPSKYPSAIESILKIRPNLYIKGIDYKNEKDQNLKLEKEAIESIGGKIIYTTTDKLSTTDIINYIKWKIK